MKHNKFFNVSIHDVTPSFLNHVKLISDLLSDLGIKKITYLVIPNYHGKENILRCVDELKRLIGKNEIALHGYTHLGRKDWLFSYRKLLTDNEGEFVSFSNIKYRIDQGLCIARSAGINPIGFIPPAWLIKKSDIDLFLDYYFIFLNTRFYIYDLRNRKRYKSPVLTFSSRGLLKKISIHTFKVMQLMVDKYDITRIALHPKDLETQEKVKIITDVIKKMKDSRSEIFFSEFIKWRQQVEGL